MELFSLFGKNSNYSSEYKQFKKSLDRNPRDFGLKTQFIKFCLLNRFTKHEGMAEHVAEALKLFEAIENSEFFDLQCHYLVGKYYQEDKDTRRAYKIYLNAIKRFNQIVGKKPDLKSENAELAYSVALNLMTLQSNPVDPEVEITFKFLRKSFPLHLKRIEFENEMAKPAPDPLRLKQLTAEIRKLKEEEDKEITSDTPVAEEKPAAATEEAPAPTKAPEPKKQESKGIHSKLFNALSPSAVGLAGNAVFQGPVKTPEIVDQEDFLKITPPTPVPNSNTAFMAFHKDQWEGPYTLQQLQSMGFMEPATWVCRAGSQQVLQAYEVPDLQTLFKR